MASAVKVKEKIVERVDFHKDRLGFTRQRLINNLLFVALGYLDEHGYESLIKLRGADNEMVQTPE